MLLWACKEYCCCKYNIHEITPYSIHESPRSRSIQVELGKVEGFWSTLWTATVSTSHIFECWAASSLATDTGESQSAVPCDNDVIRSDWDRPIGLRHLEFHARTLETFFLHSTFCSGTFIRISIIILYWEPKQNFYHSLIWICVLISIVYNKNLYTHGWQYFCQ